MKVVRSPLTIASHQFSADFGIPRSLGVHVMPVIEKMALALGMEDVPKGMPIEKLEWYRFGGFIHEYVMSRHIIEVEAANNPLVLMRPGEFMWCYECDDIIFPTWQNSHNVAEEHCKTLGHHGIFGTPDAIRTDLWMLKEFKCTWKTSRRAGGDNDTDGVREHISVGMWRWPQQLKMYSYAMEITRAQLQVMWINGDYKPPIPDGDTFEFDFTPGELKQAWSAMVSYAVKEGMLK